MTLRVYHKPSFDAIWQSWQSRVKFARDPQIRSTIKKRNPILRELSPGNKKPLSPLEMRIPKVNCFLLNSKSRVYAGYTHRERRNETWATWKIRAAAWQLSLARAGSSSIARIACTSSSPFGESSLGEPAAAAEVRGAGPLWLAPTERGIFFFLSFLHVCALLRVEDADSTLSTGFFYQIFENRSVRSVTFFWICVWG